MARGIGIFRSFLIALTVVVSGCGGSGGGHSSSPASGSSVSGVSTPSSVSVVTAQNESAGG